MNDPFSLSRFETAQDESGTYERALAELRAGRKRSHWMWFLFPQISGLGQSAMSRTYAISSLEEAKAFLEHPVLGQRLIECTRAVIDGPGQTAEAIFGMTDAMKLRSCMTLFAKAAPENALFRQALGEYFGGIPDPASERQLEAQAQHPFGGASGPGLSG